MKVIATALALLVIGRCGASAQAVKTTKALPDTVQVKQATEQRWSGGVVGRAGVRYGFTVETLPNVVVDTVWIGSVPFAVKLQANPYDYLHPSNATLTKKGQRWVYSLHGDIDHSWPMNGRAPREKTETKNRAPQYDGVALVTYTYKTKRGSVAVKKFTEMEPLNYP